jgi:hypothetical protein
MAAHEHLSQGQFSRGGGRPKKREHGASQEDIQEESGLRKSRKPRVRTHKAKKD